MAVSGTLPPLRRHSDVLARDLPRASLPDGVRVFSLQPHHDKRGYFMEIIRSPELSAIGFTPEQVSLSKIEPGIIKAFHFHKLQTDLFCPITGYFRIVLLDGREESSSFGYGYSLRTEETHPFVLLIPPGVAHGYQICGDRPAHMLYIMNRVYDPSDEYRVDEKDPSVNFPW